MEKICTYDREYTRKEAKEAGFCNDCPNTDCPNCEFKKSKDTDNRRRRKQCNSWEDFPQKKPKVKKPFRRNDPED